MRHHLKHPTTLYRFRDTATPAKDATGRLPLTVTSGTFNGNNIAITAGTMIASSGEYMPGMKKFTGYLRLIPNATAPFSVDFLAFIDPVFVDAQSYTWYIDPNGGSNGFVFGVTPQGGAGGDFGVQVDTGDCGLNTTNIFHIMFGYMEAGAGTSKGFIYAYREGTPLGQYVKGYLDIMDSINLVNTSHRTHMTVGTFYDYYALFNNEFITDTEEFTKLIKMTQ